MNTLFYEKKYIEYLKKRENELSRLPMPQIAKEAYLLYFDTGNRLEYEKIYFGRREYLTVFGMMSVLFKDKKSDRIYNVLESILDEPTWVLPAHGSREHIEGKIQSIDLFAAETAGTLAEIIYLIMKENVIKENEKNYFSDKYVAVCMHFFKEVKRRIFDIFLSKCPCDWWENASMNWSAVCSGNVGIAAYYVKKLQYILENKLSEKTDRIISEDEYNIIMDRVTDSMLCYLRSMGSDGACSEGVGYYKYGMEYFLKFYEILRAENRRENIDKIGDFHNAALFLQKVYLGNGSSVNFSDCLLKNKMKPGLLCMLSSIYDDVKINEDFVCNGSLKFDTELMEILGGEECHRWLGACSDYIWVKKYGERLKAESNNYEKGESYSIFEETQWYIKRWNRDTCFYIKGGHNDESHNHNDVGSFGYISGGEEIFCDLGVGEYTREYFGENRYNILCNSSKGHNVPVIDGLYQKAGKMYRADEFCGDEKSVMVSFGKAYDGKKSYSVIRKAVFGEDGEFSVRDYIKGAEKISERLITRIKPKIIGDRVIIDNGKEKINVKFLQMGEIYEIRVTNGETLINAEEREAGRISVSKEVHINHSGERENVYIISCDYI